MAFLDSLKVEKAIQESPEFFAFPGFARSTGSRQTCSVRETAHHERRRDESAAGRSDQT